MKRSEGDPAEHTGSGNAIAGTPAEPGELSTIPAAQEKAGTQLSELKGPLVAERDGKPIYELPSVHGEPSTDKANPVK
jgi:hypothetical protein